MYKKIPAIAVGGLLAMTAVGMSGEYEDMHACDEFAAHPSDPNRWAKGVTDEELIPGPAIKYCREAVEQYPETPRFQFQLGRALWAGQRLDDGTKVFLTLEEQFEYGPVYAYLGDAYMYGIGGVETDQELAVTLYQIAEEAGFSPASEVLANLVDSTDEPPVEAAENQANRIESGGQQAAALAEVPTISEKSVPKFDATLFSEPQVVGALNSGNFVALKNSSLGTTSMMGFKASNLTIYLNNFNGEFSGTYNFKDPSCIQIYEPAVATRLHRDIIDTTVGEGGFSPENSLKMGLGMITDLMNQMETGGGMGMVQTGHDLQILKESAAKDAAKLILTYGCQSQTVQRIYKNMVAFVYGRSPILSPDEQSRRKRQKAREAERQEQKRQQTLRTTAATSCVSRFKKKTYCDCLVETLDQQEISQNEWQDLGTDFGKLISIGKRYDGFIDKMKSCRGKS